MAEDTSPLQDSMERSARIGEAVFPSPPRSLSTLVVLLTTAAVAVLLGADLEAILEAIALVLAPAAVTVAAAPALAQLVGRTYYPRRVAVLAAGSAVALAAAVLVGVVVEGLVEPPPVGPAELAWAAVGLGAVGHYLAAVAIVDHRTVPSLALALLYPLLALPGLLLVFGTAPVLQGALSWLVLLAPVVLLARVFDAPLLRNFGVSGAELFRAYLDHVTTQSPHGEELLERFGQPVQAPVAVLAFRRPNGDRKACIAVPTVHPGPLGALGGGDLPAKVRNALHEWDHVLVPHAAADHDLNPVTTAEAERLGRYLADLVRQVETHPGGSKFVEKGENVRLAGQGFGDDLLLTYTSWPEAIDDVNQGVGHATELAAEAHLDGEALFVDCHNSLEPSSGAVFPLTPRALQLEDLADDVALGCEDERVDRLRVGCAQDTTLGLAHLVGRAGCQVLVAEAGHQRTAYVLWDGNNMVPEATRALREAVLEVVDEVRVMTTDNHAVNVEGGTYSPVGLRTDHDTLARISRRTVEAAIDDLEPVEAGAATGHAPDIKVFGHQRTAQISASVNAMVSVVPELVVTCLALWTLGLATVFLAL